MRPARIQMESFPCLRHFDLMPKPGVNLLIGENNTGKTSLPYALDRALGRGANFDLEDFAIQGANDLSGTLAAMRIDPF